MSTTMEAGNGIGTLFVQDILQVSRHVELVETSPTYGAGNKQ